VKLIKAEAIKDQAKARAEKEAALLISTAEATSKRLIIEADTKAKILYS
jgi:cell division septum initiation protein DivIVA